MLTQITSPTRGGDRHLTAVSPRLALTDNQKMTGFPEKTEKRTRSLLHTGWGSNGVRPVHQKQRWNALFLTTPARILRAWR
jgi:hypothetical protein